MTIDYDRVLKRLSEVEDEAKKCQQRIWQLEENWNTLRSKIPPQIWERYCQAQGLAENYDYKDVLA